MLESYEDTPPNYFLMNHNDDNDLYPNIFPIISLQFKNDNQMQSYLYSIEPSSLSHLHFSLTNGNAHACNL